MEDNAVREEFNNSNCFVVELCVSVVVGGGGGGLWKGVVKK